ncbi:MAG: Mur ligase domain-containing protein [Deltaproteobacteria bacterium]
MSIAAPASMDVHLTAIGGVGMTALAGLLQQLGHRVRGSDVEVYPPASETLARLGVAVAKGYAAQNLEPRPDLVVMGNAISRDNPEAIAAREAGLETVSMPAAIAKLCLPQRMPLVVAGTHGKTTSATFLAWVLQTAGLAPGWFIGGIPLDLPGPCALGSGASFVLEGDEYDSAYFDKGPKFLHYRPQAVLLTSVEFDHADIYRDLAHVKESFASLLAILPAEAPLVVSADYPHALAVARASGHEFTSFASAAAADWQIKDLVDGPGGLRFRAEGRGEVLDFVTPVLGAMNARNLLGVALLARAIGVEPAAVAEAAATFHGVRRRQELVVPGDIALIDDFAHHPTAIALALEAVRGRFPGRRLWALFDPRSNTTRRRIFQDEIAQALGVADRVCIGPVNRPEQIDEADRFSPAEAVAALGAAGIGGVACADTDAIFAEVVGHMAAGDVVTILSNGAFGGLRARLASALGAVDGA